MVRAAGCVAYRRIFNAALTQRSLQWRVFGVRIPRWRLEIFMDREIVLAVLLLVGLTWLLYRLTLLLEPHGEAGSQAEPRPEATSDSPSSAAAGGRRKLIHERLRK